ncbi:MAG: hypothetical protein JKP90_20500 [Desulfofustis sp. PB-SRB1]|nr:hypothetical protein [Desulfofustis sp. PB-SRB1]
MGYDKETSRRRVKQLWQVSELLSPSSSNPARLDFRVFGGALWAAATKKIWHLLLGTEYEHALQLLIEAKARFSGAYSDWLGLQDGFGD